jgi:rubrerythrin
MCVTDLGKEKKVMRYVCRICGYVYDEAVEKVPFRELPEDWKCPLCGAAKSDFKAADAGPEPAGASAPARRQADLEKLSAGQLAALCSNLARGCEKQYQPEQAALFGELADYFTAVTPPVNDASVEALYQMLEQDAADYAGIRATADENGDRGAARICVWGEKVTRMLSSLVGRYLREGEAMLADTDIWLCTACGFVYVGDAPPEMCPVCKVPSWKFEKIEGRVTA